MSEPKLPVSALQGRLESALQRAVTQAFGDQYAQVDPLVRGAKDPRHGDYQSNLAMSLTKDVKLKPRDVALRIVDKLQDELIATVDIAGPGFINLHLSDAALTQLLRETAQDARLGVETLPHRTTVIDYASPNLAKEMHIGHLRSTIIGDALARSLRFLGNTVIGQNHLGDWGTQFGMLLQHLLETGWEENADHTIGDLNALYQEAKKRFDSEEDFMHRARQRVVALQSGEPESLGVWRDLIKESERHMNDVFAQLGVLLTDESIRGESFYNSRLGQTLADLQAAGLAVESQGAQVVFLPGFRTAEDAPLPLIVQKGDGGYGYAATDLAAARYRINELGGQRLIYVVDSRQAQHFHMVFGVLRAAEWAPPSVNLDYVPFGTILGEDKKPFKTREGGTVRLVAVIEEAVERVERVIEEKNPDWTLEERRDVARAVGVGALKYADLSSDRIKDYVFDYDRMLSLEGNTGPYLQNAHVRICSIFRKGEVDACALDLSKLRLGAVEERELALLVLDFPNVVYAVGQHLEPHRLCGYLYRLASAFHRFFEHCPVLRAEEPDVRESRLVLIDVVRRTLSTGLDLLGIRAVERM